MNTKIYCIFHLNLAFSSIDEAAHREVIKRCYWPLLTLIDKGIPLGIELTAYTLEAIAKVDASWLQKFKELLQASRCELIASGDSQIIGPLVPAVVNQQNLRLGQASYKALLAQQPKVAYINEQAVSAGLLDIYLDAGFEAVVIEWDNPYSHNPDWLRNSLNQPQQLLTASGRQIKVIWNHAIAFQKFQRYVHGELILEDYLQYLTQINHNDCFAFPLYGSDVEVFDYRPGRYHTEAETISGEWQRIATLFATLEADPQYHWCQPRQLLDHQYPPSALTLTHAEHPVSVKKQAKYNISRWALSGWNDLRLNSLCFAQYQALRQKLTHKEGVSDNDWRALCRQWASDLRTHLTATRYAQLNFPPLVTSPVIIQGNTQRPKNTLIEYDKERQKLTLRTPQVLLILNANRGLAIEQLGFAEQQFKPVLGTLAHGHFDHISYGADFYSNHLVMERFTQRDRVTDLNKVTYDICGDQDSIHIFCQQASRHGQLYKWYKITGTTVNCGFRFDNHSRPEASLRLGYITLLNCSQRAWYQTHLGGTAAECFHIKADINQGAPVSSIVSANSLLGATEGEIKFGADKHGIKLQWDPAHCAALPMISSQKINHTYLNRLWFSLIETDETLKANGDLPDFEYRITPCDQPQEACK